MNFTTPIPTSKSNFPIDYSSKIMSIGSCFAENMAKKFDYFKFENVVNPFGIIFNPISIEKLIFRIVNKVEFKENDIFFHNESWHCYEVHSELSHQNKEEFLDNLNSILESTNNQITKSTHLIITFGTAWVYKLKTTNQVVANCHKVPQNQFYKELLSIEVIGKAMENTINLIKKINPDCNFIFTISPVRHIKDGFVENQRSKAHLITALQYAISNLQFANYFPSYEIMMDELRDYRFYADDMLHPSQAAIDYIWIKFFENYVNEKEFELMNQVCDIQKALRHKPFNESSESHQKFLSKLQDKIDFLREKLPQIHF